MCILMLGLMRMECVMLQNQMCICAACEATLSGLPCSEKIFCDWLFCTWLWTSCFPLPCWSVFVQCLHSVLVRCPFALCWDRIYLSPAAEPHGCAQTMCVPGTGHRLLCQPQMCTRHHTIMFLRPDWVRAQFRQWNSPYFQPEFAVGHKAARIFISGTCGSCCAAIL